MGRIRLLPKSKKSSESIGCSYWIITGTECTGSLFSSASIKENTSSNKEGEILDFDEDGLIVGCKKGSLKIKTIQAPSKKAVTSSDYIRGKRLNKGQILI